MPNIDEQEDFLRKKIDESAVDYNDKYWEDAKQMLGEKRRRKFGWWWMPVIILLPVIAGVTYFGLKENNSHKQNATVPTTHTNNIIAQRNTIVSPANDGIPQRDAIVPSASNSIASPNAKEVQLSATRNVQTNSIISQPANIKKKKDAGKIKTLARTTAPYSTINNKTILKTSASSSSNAQSIVSASSNSINANNADRLSNTGSDKSEIENQLANASANERASLINNSVTAKPLNDTTNSTSIQTTLANQTSKINTGNSIDTAKQVLKDTTAIASIPAITTKVDTATNHPESKSKFRNKILAINAGCNFNRGINATGGNSFTLGALPYLGVSFAIPVTSNNRVTLQGGLVFNMYNQLHSITEVHHSNYYSFGYGNPAEGINAPPTPVSDTVFSLHQQLLFTLQLPVVFNYYINGKNRFSIGAGIAYTLGVYSKVVNFNGTETKSFGYGDGYKPFNAFVQLGYCYNFTKSWGLSINIQQGLTDMTDDAFFNATRKDRFTNLQIGLIHEFAIKPKNIFYDKK